MTFTGVSSGKMGFPDGSAGKESAQCRRHKKHASDPWLGRYPGGGNGNPHCIRKGEAPLQGLRSGLLSNTRKRIVQKNCPSRHVLTKQKIFLGKGSWVERVGEGNPGELLCHVARSLGFYGDGISFRVVFGQSF